MTVGDIGVPIVYTAPAGISLTGATVTLKVAIGPPSADLFSASMTPDSYGLRAIYLTVGDEWPSDAVNVQKYKSWIEVDLLGGDSFTSDPGYITVQPLPQSDR